MQRVIRLVRNFLFSSVNREFLIFLFFLALSGVFWLLMALNETYEKEIKIPVRIVNVPKNVVVSDAVDTMRVTVRDKGWFIAALIYGNRVRPVYIDFLTYSKNNNGECSVSTSDLIKQVVQMLSGSARVTAAKPDKIEFFFSYGESKRVPVKFIGKVTPDETYYLARMLIQPDSITVFASPEILDKIHYVSTEELRYSHFADTITVNAHLQKIRGAKINQSAVKITFFTDILTEESIDVPITGENLPMGKVLRTFPSHVTVSFITGVANYRRLRPDNFSVVVDYNDLQEHPSDKCSLHLRSVPHGISRLKLSVNSVDYLIEEE